MKTKKKLYKMWPRGWCFRCAIDDVDSMAAIDDVDFDDEDDTVRMMIKGDIYCYNYCGSECQLGWCTDCNHNTKNLKKILSTSVTLFQFPMLAVQETK